MGRIQAFLVAVLIFLGSVAVAGAQGPITATGDATLLNEMPRRLHFTLDASTSAGELTEARLFIKIAGASARISEPVPFDPAPTVTLEHEWQMQSNGVPPGVRVEYFWRLTDSAGNNFETPTATIVPLDPRFDWQTIEDDELAISWYDGNQAWGQQMFDTGKAALTQLEEELGADVTRQVRLLAYATNDDFRGAFPPQQDWIGGQAFSDLGVTIQIIGAGEQEWMRTVLYHELSHLVFNQAMEGALASRPAWLEEGLAMYNEPDDNESYSRDSAQRVEEAAEANELIPFSQLQGNFGADGEVVGLAYAQSEMLVTYLIDDCGQDGFRELVQGMVDDLTVDDALTAACGYDSRALYDQWRQTLPNAPAPVSPDGPPAEEPAPAAPSTVPESEPPISPNLLLLLVGVGFCFIGLLLVAILFVLYRLLRPQPGAR